MTGRVTGLLLTLLCGCASSPGAAPQAAGSGLFDEPWLASPDAVSALRRRLSPHRDAPACVAERVRLERDAAHTLWLLTDDAAARASLSRAFARLGEPQHERSDAAAAAQPAAHAAALADLRAALAAPRELALPRATAARDAFAELGDELLAAEAELVLAGATRSDPGPGARPRSTVQTAVAAYLALRARLDARGRAAPAAFDAAMRAALGAGHGVVLERLEALRALGAAPDLGPEATLAWLRGLARAALERGAPLLAVRHALALRGSAGATPLDRVLLAQAYAAAGEAEEALLEAQLAAEAAGDAATTAAAEAAVGGALLRMRRGEEAVAAFDRARQAFARAGDPRGAARQGLNQAVGHLEAGDPARAREVLAGLTLPEEPAELRARREAVCVLAALLGGELTPRAAAARLELALAAAREAGAFTVVEDYAGLVERLRRPETP